MKKQAWWKITVKALGAAVCLALLGLACAVGYGWAMGKERWSEAYWVDLNSGRVSGAKRLYGVTYLWMTGESDFSKAGREAGLEQGWPQWRPDERIKLNLRARLTDGTSESWSESSTALALDRALREYRDVKPTGVSEKAFIRGCLAALRAPGCQELTVQLTQGTHGPKSAVNGVAFEVEPEP